MPKNPCTEDRAKPGDPSTPQERQALEIARGLLDPKHREQLAEALHFYLQLLDARPFPSAFVHGGRPVGLWVLRMMASPLGGETISERTIQRWLKRLEHFGYISIRHVNTGKARGSGLRIRVLKSKHYRGSKTILAIDHPPTPMTGGPPTPMTGGSVVQGCAATGSTIPPSVASNPSSRRKKIL